MGRGRHAGYDDQRELILAQAAALFAKTGYAGTSMNQVAEASGLSKATLYHYYRDKYALLVSITEGHVLRLQGIVGEAVAEERTPQGQMRVLTEDVKFRDDADRKRVLDIEREVVAGFARVVIALRPDLEEAALGKPLTMLLFGMINWLFTWMKPDGALGYDDIAP